MSRRALLLAAGVALLLAGVLLPRGWYDALPWGPELPPQPIKGVTLLQLAFVLEGLLLVWLGRRDVTWRMLDRTSRPDVPDAPDEALPDARTAGRVLAGITALALVLRLAWLGSDLWLDEITPIRDYLTMPALEVFASYQRSNNHLLQTLWMKAAVAMFGEREWAVRLLPALLGAATVPALYWTARLALSRGAALAAALLLAVSYHHIFFSQSARGYAGYLLFGVLSSGLLVRALRDDRLRDWARYVGALVLGFATQLLTTFVAAAHGLVGLMALWAAWRRGAARPLLRRLAAAFAVAGLLVFHLYAAIIPQALVVAQTTYSRATSGYALLSAEFLREVMRGLSAGFGPGLLLGAIPFLAIMAAGFVTVWRRQRLLAAALVLPELVTTAFLLIRGFSFSPRFFLMAVPLAMVCVAQGLWGLAGWLGRRRSPTRPDAAPRIAVALVAAVALASLTALPSYYRTPRQNYRGSIRFVERERRPGDVVIVFGVAESGYRYYTRRLGVADSGAYRYVRSEAAVDSIVAGRGAGAVWFVTTFARDMRLKQPRLAERLRSPEWSERGRFPATVGDGAILVWRRS